MNKYPGGVSFFRFLFFGDLQFKFIHWSFSRVDIKSSCKYCNCKVNMPMVMIIVVEPQIVQLKPVSFGNLLAPADILGIGYAGSCTLSYACLVMRFLLCLFLNYFQSH